MSSHLAVQNGLAVPKQPIRVIPTFGYICFVPRPAGAKPDSARKKGGMEATIDPPLPRSETPTLIRLQGLLPERA